LQKNTKRVQLGLSITFSKDNLFIFSKESKDKFFYTIILIMKLYLVFESFQVYLKTVLNLLLFLVTFNHSKKIL